MNRLALGAQLLTERGDRGQRRQFNRREHQARSRNLTPNAIGGSFALRRVAHRHHDLGAGSGKSLGNTEPDAVARAGHNGALAGQVGKGERHEYS